MDLGTVAQWVAVVLSITALVVAWINRRTDKISDLEHRQDRLDGRMQKIETELGHMPGQEAIHKLEMALTKMEGQLQVVLTRVEQSKHISERLQEALIKESVHK